MTDLPIGDTNERFFVAVITFDFPAIDIGLKQEVNREIQIRADQKSGVAVKEFGTVTEPITKRFDDDQTEWAIETRFAPKEMVNNFS